MAPLAVFGIENDGLNLTVNLLLLVLVVLWFALIYWTYADARRRIIDPMLVGCATAASFFPFVGTVVYLIVRPPESLEDRRERELEIAAAEARLTEFDQHACAYCGFEVEKNFLRCPSCLRKLKEPCTVCGKPLDPRWKICPYCEAEVGQAPAEPRQPRQQRRPAQRASAAAGRQQAPRPAPPEASRPASGGATVESPAARPPKPAAAERPPRPTRERPPSAG